MSKRAVTHLSSDPVMSELILRVGRIGFKPRRLSPFQSLAHAIIHQQLSGNAAGTILRRFMLMFPKDPFPTPAAIAKSSIAALQNAGLSRPKAAYIIGLAERCEAGLLPTLEQCDALSDEAIIETLTASKGVGRWTAEMFLIFNLGRPDVLPADDLGVRRGFQIAYRKRAMPEPERLADFGRRWGPHRTMAARYLWRAADAAANPNW